jgi:hypothetical protein
MNVSKLLDMDKEERQKLLSIVMGDIIWTISCNDIAPSILGDLEDWNKGFDRTHPLGTYNAYWGTIRISRSHPDGYYIEFSWSEPGLPGAWMHQGCWSAKFHRRMIN